MKLSHSNVINLHVSYFAQFGAAPPCKAVALWPFGGRLRTPRKSMTCCLNVIEDCSSRLLYMGIQTHAIQIF
jgi:hypothetical protein